MAKNIYLEATRKKLRFSTNQGVIAVEDLFDIAMSVLKNLGRDLHSQLKKVEEDIFDSTPTEHDCAVVLSFEIVKDIVEIRTEEAKKALDRKERAEKKQRLLGLLADKELEAEGTKSIAELRKEIEEMD